MVGWTATGLAWAAQCSLTFSGPAPLSGQRQPAQVGRRSTSQAPSSWSRLGWSFTSFRCSTQGSTGHLSQTWSFPTFGAVRWVARQRLRQRQRQRGDARPSEPWLPRPAATGRLSCLRPVGRSVRSSAVAGGDRTGLTMQRGGEGGTDGRRVQWSRGWG